MRLRQRILKGGAELIVGQIGEQALSFLRNMIVARILSPDDFGVAATFTLIMTTLQMISDMAFGRFIVQASDGDSPVLQNTTHSVMLARGLLTGGLLILVAPMLGILFGIPEVTWAYAWLALAPIIRGLGHSDVNRFQRELKFRSQIGISFFSQLTAFLAAVGLAFWLKSYEAILWSTIVQALAWTTASHIFAERRYRLGWSPEVFRRLWVFGWPLMINGMILFSANLGDRFLVGAAFSMSELALYSLAGAVVFVPSLLTTPISGTLFLPLLSQVKDDRQQFRRRHGFLGIVVGILTIGLIVPLIALGSAILPLIFGAHYVPPDFLVAFLAVASGMRICRSWAMTTAISIGRTRSLMYANFLRLTGIASGAIAVGAGYGLVVVAAAIAGAEFVATVYAIFKVNRDAALPRYKGIGVLGTIVAAYAISLMILDVWRGDYIVVTLSAAVTIVIALTMLILSSADARNYGRALVSSAVLSAKPD